MSLETVIGLEIHAELLTSTKLFCSCPSRFGAPPNTSVCPICLGHPNTRPIFNRSAADLAIRAGLALGSEIRGFSAFDRKHYTYPDLPKSYQITQFYHPICLGGSLSIGEKAVRITRIHIEEDAGKQLHEPDGIKIDFNRCGVPLIEIVTEPDISTAEEASEFCRRLRRILLFAGVCDGKMNEGSFRCDINLSLHRPGEPLGERTEIKNLNSFRFIEQAIRAEAARQTAILEAGGKVTRQTLRFEEKTRLTVPMREKEETADYRYCPEPDLAPLVLDPSEIEEVRAAMPTPYEVYETHFSKELGLSEEITEQLLLSPENAARFADCAALTNYPIPCGRLWAMCVKDKPVDTAAFAALSDLLGREEITQNDAKTLAAELTERTFDPSTEADARGMRLICDPTLLDAPIAGVLAANPDKVRAYREGKTALLGFFIGAVKKSLDAPISPKLLSEAVKKKLDQPTEESHHE